VFFSRFQNTKYMCNENMEDAHRDSEQNVDERGGNKHDGRNGGVRRG